MWCLIFLLNTTKLSNILIIISLVLLSQTKRERNMIIYLLQQGKWFMACYMSHQVKHKTRSKATTMTQNMVTELMIIGRYRHQLHQFNIFSTWKHRILKIKNILNVNLLAVDTPRKVNGKYLGILSKLP